MMCKLSPRCFVKTHLEKKLSRLVWGAQWLRDVEPDAASSLCIDLFQLMVRAGTAAFDVFSECYKDRKHWLILAGAGNNGGDGYVVARAALATGKRVTVWAMPRNRSLPKEASNALAMLLEAGGVVREVTTELVIPDDVDLVVDGLLGTGMTGVTRGLYAQLIERVNALPVARVAIDIPSGLNAETGEAAGSCVKADHTVTFICLKPGLLTGQARDYVGQLHYHTLGLEDWLGAAERRDAAFCGRLSHEDLSQYFGVPRPQGSHKGLNGKVVVVGGSNGFGGAAVMAAEGSLNAGAGLTRVVTMGEHVAPLLTRCPEAMYVGVDRADQPDAVAAAVGKAVEWADVVAVGPGLGRDDVFGKTALEAVLQYATVHTEKAVVLDADALNMLPAYLQQFHRSEPLRLPRSIITPHVGEAARLLGCSVDDIEKDRFDAARRLAGILGGVCVLKGPGSVVYDHVRVQKNEEVGEQRTTSLFSARNCAIVDAGNAGMATGGTGDVLTGILAGVVAQKRKDDDSSVFDAACAGTLVHATAADLAAFGRGTRGLRPIDILSHVTECVNASCTTQL